MRIYLHIFSIALLLAGTIFLANCSDTSVQKPNAKNVAAIDTKMQVLPRKLLFQPPVQFQGRISPNGAKVSWLSKADGALNLFVADANDPASARQYTFGKRGVDIHEWSANSAFILFTSHAGNNKYHKTFSLNLYSGEIVPLGPKQDAVTVSLQKISRNWPNTALVAINKRDPKWLDLYRINLQTGTSKLILNNPGFAKWVADDDLNARIGIRENPDGSADWLLLFRNGQARLLFHVEAKNKRGTRPLQIDPSGTVLYFLDQRGRSHSVFSSLDLTNGQIKILGQVPGYSVQRVVFHPVTGTPLAWSFNADVPNWVALDNSFQSTLNLSQKQLGPNVQFLASTSDMQRIVLYSNSPDRPGKYSLLDRDTQIISTMFETAPAALIPKRSKTILVEIPTRDGFVLHGFLSPANNLSGVKPQVAPLVLLPQPWPGSRMVYSYDPQIQWMNSRGYSVLEINTRGAGNMGPNYDQQMAGKYLTYAPMDLIDSANWSIEQGWANAGLISSIGTGFGGLNVLQALAQPDNPFACAVTMDAVVDVGKTFDWIRKKQPSSYSNIGKFFKDSDGKIDHQLMQDLSPDQQSKNIKAPLLMLQSNRLPGVALPSTLAYATALSVAGTPITLAVLAGDFEAWYENKVIAPALTLSESFLADCLGGASEPIGDDLSGIKIQFPIGGTLLKQRIDAAKTVEQP